MKKPLRRNSAKRNLVRLVLFAVGLIALGMLLPRVFAAVGAAALYPVQVTQQWFANTSLLLPALWRDKATLQDEILALQSQLANQGDTSVSVQRLREDNQQLRSLLGASTTPRIAAAVVGRPDRLPYDVLQIDRGSDAGVAVGAPVYINDQQVIGLVTQVYRDTALATLFTTPDFSTTAYVGKTDVLATLTGLGGGVARVAVPQGLLLQTGSLVYLPSIQPGVYGTIIHIENEPTQPQQFGYIALDVPLQHLRYVSVGQTSQVNTDELAVTQYIELIKSTLALPQIMLSTTTSATSSATTSITTATSS